MSARHFLSLRQINPLILKHLVERSMLFATDQAGEASPLLGKTVGIYFRRSSTRTRTSFTVGAMKLGADVISYGPGDLQIETGETLEDTGRVLAGYLDALVIRTNDPQIEMEALADQSTMPVINAMSAEEHPSQAIADLSTIQEACGRIDDLQMLYLGEGNNSALALAFAMARTRQSRLTLKTPEGYGLPRETLEQARHIANANGSVIEQSHSMDDLPVNVDVVYTTRWHTMGVSKPDPNWREQFLPFSATQSLMDRVSKPKGTIFMHDLPAVRGDEVHNEVLDGPQSWAWRQARYKMWSAMAILEWCLNDGGPRG